MNAEPVTVRRLGIGLAVAVALITSGCAAGQQAQTAYLKAVEEGTEANVGDIALRGVALEAPSGATPYYPAGGAASVRMVIVNSGRPDDRLTGITSSAFTAWGAFSTPADASAAAAPASSVPASASSAVSASPAPAPMTSVPIPGGGRVSWGVPEAKGALLLLHLKQRLYPGGTVVLTFTFASAGSVTVRVPVALSATPNSSVIPAPSSSGAG